MYRRNQRAMVGESSADLGAREDGRRGRTTSSPRTRTRPNHSVLSDTITIIITTTMAPSSSTPILSPTAATIVVQDHTEARVGSSSRSTSEPPIRPPPSAAHHTDDQDDHHTEDEHHTDDHDNNDGVVVVPRTTLDDLVASARKVPGRFGRAVSLPTTTVERSNLWEVVTDPRSHHTGHHANSLFECRRSDGDEADARESCREEEDPDDTVVDDDDDDRDAPDTQLPPPSTTTTSPLPSDLLPSPLVSTTKDEDDPQSELENNDTDQSPSLTQATTDESTTTATAVAISLPSLPSLPPDNASLIASTDAVFHQVQDPSTVTVRDVWTWLQQEYGKDVLTASHKAMVKDRLVHLVTTTLQANHDNNNNNVSSDESTVGDDESDAVHRDTPRRTTQPTRRGSHRTAQARRAQRLRDLVVADELQGAGLNQDNHSDNTATTARDRAVIRHIQAKLQHDDTEEARDHRRAQRWKLLHTLDDQRLACVGVTTTTAVVHPNQEVGSDETRTTASSHTVPSAHTEPSPTVAPTNHHTPPVQDSDDSSDEEFEIEGTQQTLGFDPLRSPPRDALSLLDRADRALLGSRATTTTTTTMTRARLQQSLRASQRRMGNAWLARELGYDHPDAHVQACRALEEERRAVVAERERVRVEEQQQRRRHRLAQGGAMDDHDDGVVVESLDVAANEDTARSDASDEEDEEMAMAWNETEEGRTGAGKETVAAAVTVRSTDDATDETEASLPLETQPPVDWMAPEAEVEPSKKASDEDRMDTVTRTDDDNNNRERDRRLTGDQAQDDTDDDVLDTQAPTLTEAVLDGTAHNDDVDESTQITNDGTDPDAVNVVVVATTKPKGPRNSAWKAMLQKDADRARKQKKSKLVEEEADEEEEEEVAGLEDFGFVVPKKKEDDEDADPGDFDEDDLKHVVDDLSDDEGDEEAGDRARKSLEQKEEKERHQELMRRMRDGYDGRRGGIAVGGAGARGMHRFDQLVAADNREDAKRLGLLNDDEVDSDDEGGKNHGGDDEEEDEAVLLDNMLKDRFLHRSSVDQENFSDDEEEDEAAETATGGPSTKEDEEERQQDRLAKRFAKRARMQRIVEAHGHEEMFSESNLMEEENFQMELSSMRNGLARKRSNASLSQHSFNNDTSSMPAPPAMFQTAARKKQKNGTTTTTLSHGVLNKGGSLAIALQASRRSGTKRTSFACRSSSSGSSKSSEVSSSFSKSIAFSHVVFHAADNSKSQSGNSLSNSSSRGSLAAQPPKRVGNPSWKNHHGSHKRPASLFSKTVLAGFGKRRKM